MDLDWKKGSKRFRPFYWLSATLLGLFLGCLSLLLTIYVGALLFVNADLIRNQLIANVQSQTGGRLDVRGVRFDILRGLVIEGLGFFPPSPEDPRGFVYGGPVTKGPLFKAETIDVAYDIIGIFSGNAGINSLKIVSPRIDIEETDGIGNFSGILAYRQKHFPSQPKPEEPEEPEESGEEGPLIPEIPIRPNDLYLPLVTLTAANIGLEDIGLRYKKTIDGKEETAAEISGLSIGVGGRWQGFESRFFAKVSSVAEGLAVLLRTPSQNLNGNMRIENEFAIENFDRIFYDVLLEVAELKSQLPEIRDFKLVSKLRSEVHKDYRGLHIDGLSLGVSDILNYKLSGDLGAASGSQDEIQIDLVQKFDLSIDELVALAKPFIKDVKPAKGLQAGGRVELDNLRIEGRLDPRKLGKDPEAALPSVAMRILLEDIAAEIPAMKAVLKPLNGYLSVAASRSPTGSGSQVDLTIDLTHEGGRVAQDTKLGRATASFESMEIGAVVRVLYPQLIAPVVKVSVESPQLKAKTTKLEAIEVPLHFSLDAELDKALNRVMADLEIDIGDVYETSINARCRKKCADVKVGARIKVPSLAKVHSLVYPMADPLGLAEVMPTKLTGSVEIQSDIEADLPPPLETAPDVLIKEAKPNVSARVNVDSVDVNAPTFQTVLNGLSTKINVTANRESQKIDINTGFDGLSLKPPAGNKEASKGDAKKGPRDGKISIGRFYFDSTIRNSILSGVDIADVQELAKNTKSSMALRIETNDIDARAVAPVALTRVGLSVEARQSLLQDFSVEKITADIPDFGLRFLMKASTSLNEIFFPKKVALETDLSIDHSGGKVVPGGISTSGKMRLTSKIDSDDMKELRLEAKAGFDEFSVVAKDKTKKTIGMLSGMSGEFPIKQKLDISKIVADVKSKMTDPEGAKLAAAKRKAADLSAKKEITAREYTKNQEAEKSKNRNMVALVDYSTVRPFYPGKFPISIRRIEAANLALEEIEFDVEIRQDIFALNQFSMAFLGGKIQGGFQLLLDSSASDPMEILRSARASLHMTRLNSHKLIERFPDLKDKKGFSVLGSNPYIDGTVHLMLDVPSADMAGGINITSIGKEQLRMILYYVDPKEEDPTIGQIRMALNFGEVKLVSIPIKNGEIGIEVDVRLLALPIPLPKISKIPIAQIVRNFKGQGTTGVVAKKKDDEEFDDNFEEPRL